MINPVAMPAHYGDGMHQEFTLEDYFRNLDKQFGAEPEVMCETEETKAKQIGGTHYQKAIQPWDIISAWELDFWEGNVLKYLLRYRFKDGVKDLEKAKHYLEYLIERENNG
jgi:alpha-ketoglutarate-dependent taurine dioxygenase